MACILVQGHPSLHTGLGADWVFHTGIGAHELIYISRSIGACIEVKKLPRLHIDTEEPRLAYKLLAWMQRNKST